MPKVANLSADLVANTTKFEADLKRADRALNSSRAQWTRMLNSIDKQFGALGGSVDVLKSSVSSLAGIIGAGSLGYLIKESIDAVGGLGELAAQVGVTTDTLQAFQYAASQVGLSSEEMQAGLAKLTRSIGDAAEGSKTAIDAFDALGVKILDSSNGVRSTESVIRDVADALQNIDDPARRASTAIDLFGKAGQKMLPFLENGAGGIDDLVAQAKELGLVFDTETIAKADAASDALAGLTRSFTVLGQNVALTLAGPLKDFIDYINASIPDVKLFLDTLTAPARFMNALKLNSALDDLKAAADLSARAESDFEKGLIGQRHLDEARANYEALKNTVADLSTEFRALTPPKELPIDPAWQQAIANQAGGVSNPPPKPTSTPKKTPAEIQAESLAKKIADLQLQVYTFDLGGVDKEIATALAGVDQGLPGAKEAVTTITTLIRGLNELKVASEEDKAAVAEFDAIIADADAAWQKRVDDGKALTESLQTPLEAYNARLAELSVMLKTGTIDQETFNRAVAQAKDDFEKASDGSTLFRDAADDAMGILQAGLVDAAFEADNLRDALVGVLKQLAKMAANKAFAAIADKGLDALFSLFSSPDIPIGPTFRGHATGGPAGGLALVGERGPELVNLPAGSFVHTAKTSTAMLAQRVPQSSIGAGGIVINAPMTFEGGGGTSEQNTDLAEKMQAHLERAVKSAVDAQIGDNQRSGGLLNSGMGF